MGMTASDEVCVFGIGLGRTGRASLTKALNDLGFRSKHMNDGQALQKELLAESGNFSVLKQYRGIIGGIAPFFRQLDTAFPSSKFILTVRDISAWLAERQRMADLEGKTFARLCPGDLQTITSLRQRLYGSTEFDRARYLEAYQRHVDDVCAYFKNRPEDLLVMNIPAGDGWEVLCRFLDRPVPRAPFPHRNDWQTLVARYADVERLRAELASSIPDGASFILVDDNEIGAAPPRAVRFLSPEGFDCAPRDDATALTEFERMRGDAADFIVFTRASFWWFDYYRRFYAYLCSTFPRLIETSRLVVFDVRG
jgi:hypothetical protein